MEPITAKILDIKVNKESKIAVVSVRVRRGGKDTNHPFKLTFAPGNTINFDEFRKRLEEHVNAEMQVEKTLKELEAAKGKEFELFSKDGGK